MSDRTFDEGIALLLRQIPGAKVTGRVVVDQVYAHYQHAHPEFHHPDGGKAFYLRDPLFQKYRTWYGDLADGAITEEGSDLQAAMEKVVERISTEGVYEEAPWEFGDLRGSGHPIVEVDGEVTYDRAPLVHRLSEDELRAKDEMRYLFDPHRYRR